jgi:hypothetical protein
MSVAICPMRGPLDDETLGWITELYGPVDTKYRSLDYVRHQFVNNPFGWAVHVFALDGERAVGHCGVVPFHARFGDEPIVAGKLEGLAVDAAYRGRRADDGGSVATDILSTLYPYGLDNGMEVLFGLAPPRTVHIHVRAGCRHVPIEAPAWTMVANVAAFGQNERSRRRQLAAGGLGVGQRALAGAVRLALRPSARAEQPTAADAELATAHTAPGRWTVCGADAWDWYVGSGVLRALEIGGANGCRALLRVDESDETTVQVVAWRPRRAGLLPALLLLGAAARIARDRHAPTLRFQPWLGDAGNGVLARACALLGFVKRPEADLLVYSDDPRYDSVQLTPFFYVTF